MNQTASRLHPLYSSQMVLRTTQALTANMAQDMGLVKKVLKSSRERDSARRKLDYASGPRIMASSMGGWGNPALSIR